MISTSIAFREALYADSLKPRWLLEIAGLYWTTHHRDLALDGVTWLSKGAILKIPQIKRQRELKAHSISLQISALDTAVRQHFMDGALNWVGSSVGLHLCLLDDSDTVIGGEKVTQYKGLFDQVTLEGDAMTVSVQSPFAKPSQTAGRLVTNQSQRSFKDSDRFMEYAHLKFENLQWGGEID